MNLNVDLSGVHNLPNQPNPHGHSKSFWLWVLCLTGVDYFSTLGYQPSIAFNNAGMLSPLATFVLVLATLFGALPVYRYVARKSPHGQGSIAMLEELVHGWTGKTLVLLLVGFAATDFVITKTMSAADAAEHLIHNPLWASPAIPKLFKSQMLVTSFLLVLLGATFIRGFKEVIGLAVVLVGAYLFLNVLLVLAAGFHLMQHPGLIAEWWGKVMAGRWELADPPLGTHTEWWALIIVNLLIFPKLALGLSGFETGVAVMPLVKGDDTDTEEHPEGRIRNTQKLLMTAAVVMSALLICTSLITTTLIDPIALKEFKPEEPRPTAEAGKAANRALAYIAHGGHREGLGPVSPLFGEVFGTIYDISTIVILWFAGASAMAGLLNLVPKYLPRYGMAPEWARAIRPLVLLFTAINFLVTFIFDASVEAQGGAYATGVLVLMSSACVATVIDIYRERRGHWARRLHWGYLMVAVVFVYTTGAVILEKPEGIKIATFFIVAILLVSIISRALRSTEMRFSGFEFVNEQSRLLWDAMRDIEIPILVPHRPGNRSLAEKEDCIRSEHHLGEKAMVVFIEAELGDASEFYQRPRLEVSQESEGRFVLRATKCASIPHAIAALALELSKGPDGVHPPEIHFGWSNESPMAASASFLLLGQGNVPWMVRELIRKAEPDPARQPRVVIG